MAWHRVYLALTAVSTVLLGLVVYDVAPFGDLRPVAAGAFIVILFAVASVGHWYDARRARRRIAERPPDFPAALDEEVRYREEGDEASREDSGDGERDDDGSVTDREDR